MFLISLLLSILVKLNRIYGWRPEPFYNITEVERHPEMPQDLKEHIRSVWEAECRGRRFQDECPKLNMTWLHCDGEVRFFIRVVAKLPVRRE